MGYYIFTFVAFTIFFILYAEDVEISLPLYISVSFLACIRAYFEIQKEYGLYMKRMSPDLFTELYYNIEMGMPGILFPGRMYTVVLVFAVLCVLSTLLCGRFSKFTSPLLTFGYIIFAFMFSFYVAAKVSIKFYNSGHIWQVGYAFLFFAPALLIPEKIKKQLDELK